MNKNDFIDSLDSFIGQIDPLKEGILVLYHDKKEKDCLTALGGNWEVLSQLLSSKDSLKSNNDQYQEIRKTILNTAYNICMNDKEIKKTFIKGLKNPPSNDGEQAPKN